MKNKYIMTELGTTNISELPMNPQMANKDSSNTPTLLTKEIVSEQHGSQRLEDTNAMQVNTTLGLGHEDNVKIENYGQHLNEQMRNKKPVEIDYSAKLSAALQEASNTGATNLPPRDIPHDTLPHQHDKQTTPDFIPEQKDDYIGNILDNEKIIYNNQIKQNKIDNVEFIYEQIQMPLLISVIYFVFQIPLFKRWLFKLMPKLFKPDGNANIYGYIFNSILFGLTYFIMTKSILYINNNL